MVQPEFFSSLMRRLIKTFFLLSFIMGIALLVFGFYITKEMSGFQERWAREEKLLLLKDTGTLQLHLGVSGTFMDGKQPHVLTESEKVRVIKALQEKNDDLLLQNNYMVIIFTRNAFEGVTGEITYSSLRLPAEQVKSLLVDAQPRQTLTTIMQNRGIATPLPITTDDELKGLLFALLFEEGVRNDPFFFMNEYRKGTITIIPERFLFSLLKNAPDTFYEQLKSTVVVQGK